MGYTKFQADLLVLHQDLVDIGRVFRTMSELVILRRSISVSVRTYRYLSGLIFAYFTLGTLDLRANSWLSIGRSAGVSSIC
jgi:hypothetical protein